MLREKCGSVSCGVVAEAPGNTFLAVKGITETSDSIDILLEGNEGSEGKKVSVSKKQIGLG